MGGGDEVQTRQWSVSKAALQSLVRFGAEQVNRFQPRGKRVAKLFGRKVVELLKARGRRVAAWDEAQHVPSFPEDGIVMAWNSIYEAKAAVEAGRQAVVAPMSVLYFDHAQSPNEPESQGGCTSWQQVYDFDPLSGEL